MIFLLSIITYIALLVYDYKNSLYMAQQNLYNDDNRFLKWTINDFKKIKIPFKCLLIMILAFIFLISLKLEAEIIIGIYFFVVNLILLIYKIKEDKKSDVKIAFKVTARVKRLIVTNLLLIILLSFGLKKIYMNLDTNYCYLILLVYDLLLNFIIMLTIIINKPIEKLVYLSFKNKAIKRLNESNSLDVIGITGSYGKTSTKTILSDILNVKYNALPTPKNFNTPYGLIITINNYLDKFDDYLIAEMGAYKIGEIQELCDLVKPKYGILTKIGTAHLEIFGSQENIQKGKFELIESLPPDGIGVLNGDDELQLNYKLKNTCKIVWIGIENENVDVHASNIKVTNEGTTFDCKFKGDSKTYKFTTKLLGYSNIYNILSSIALAKELGLSIEDMKKGVLKAKSIEHRLELKPSVGNITFIDDAYNSNPIGSKTALDILKLMPGKRIIITPGMVELGEKSYELNKELGMYMKGNCDEVILVGKKITEPIQDGLKESGFKEKNIHIVKSINEGIALAKSLAKDKETYILLENDLPDSYNE